MPKSISKVTEETWIGVDKDLFEILRDLRKMIAGKKRVPAYIVFDDTTLREIARQKPTTMEALLSIRGIGEKKQKQFDEIILSVVKEYYS